MPSVAVTPASYAITWGEVGTVPARVTATRLLLTMTMGDVTAGPGTGATLSVTTPNLDRLTVYDKPPGADEAWWHRQVAIWQDMCLKIEEAFDALTTQVTDNTTMIARIAAAQALAQAANDNAEDVQERTSLADSYTDPAGVLTAANDGTITIAAHDRVYGSGDRVSVNAGSATGFANGAYVTVYYVDAGREGGAVTYQGTTSAISQEGATHIVGQVTIPAAGAAAVAGTSPSAPGYTPPSGGGGSYVEP